METEDTIVIPGDLDAAIQDLLCGPDVKNLAKVLMENDFVARTHHGLGQWIRNNWGLWSDTGPLIKWFHSQGLYHPDDMSGVILTSFWRYCNYFPIRLGDQIKYYLDYWASQNHDPKAEYEKSREEIPERD